MGATWTTLLRVFLVAILLGQAIGAAYFASVVNHHIHPYFDFHDMATDASTAQLVFVYLFFSAVFSSISFMTATISFWLPSQSSNEKKPVSCWISIWRTIQACFSFFMITMGIITAKTSWSWGRLFETDNESYLAKQCYGLAEMMIAMLVIIACLFFGAVVLYLATHVTTRMDNDTKSSTDESFAKDIESQQETTDVYQKDQKSSKKQTETLSSTEKQSKLCLY
ncbi:hypothetical protein UCREL1_696 [Eutypa lata UCREL1]|uniref:Uncharacterized protein n=1 Tax=Eutypa lata (strain UCR-EL1) TaxID=1287681 RepID=M7T5V1_EUTLA|nr:hypothetical protein UCREL1_696 [Eutypa lata UCREL1]